MKTSWLMIAILACPASASLTGQPSESRWNLLDILPNKPGPASAPANSEAQLAAAEAAAAEGQSGRAVFLYRLFIDQCPTDLACADYLDRARLGLGRALAHIAPPENQESPAAKEAAYWLESIHNPDLRAQAEPERLRMRELLAKKGLLAAVNDARRGAWEDASARVENYAAEYPDAGRDEGARKYLAELRDMGRSGGSVPVSGVRMAERAEQLLTMPASPAPAPAHTRAAAPAAPRPEPLPSFQSAVAGASASGGAAFDGASRDKAPLSVSLAMRNGQPNEVAVRTRDWEFAVGQLGVGDRSGLLGESPYLNVRRVTRSPLESAIDRRLELQAGVVDVKARYFGDNAQSPSFDRLSDMAQRLGLPASSLDSIRSRFSVEDPWRQNLGVMLGSLYQAGRAVRLPFQSSTAVDLAWSATTLVKTADYVPNAAANASVGMRVTLPTGHQGALMGGWTEEALPVGHDVLSNLARGNELKLNLTREGSRQATAAISGPIPGTIVNFQLGASQRWSDNVTEQKVQAGLSSTIAGKPVQVRMSYKDEHGKSIEYGRRGAAVEASLTFAPGSSVYALCEKEKISYGGVDVSNDGCLTGLRWTPGTALTVNADVVFRGKDSVSDKGSAEAAALAASIGRLGAAGLEVTDRIAAQLDPWKGLNAALDVIAKLPPIETAAALDAINASPLPPQAKELIAGLLSKIAAEANVPNEAELRRLIERQLGPIPDLQKEYAAKRTLAGEVIGLLSDPTFWDGAVQSAVRSQILASVTELKVSVGPLGTLRITPAAAMLMASAAHYHGSPLSPLTKQDAELFFQRTVLGGIGGAIGAPLGGDSLAIANTLIDRSRDAFASALETNVISQIPQLTDRIALANQALSYLPAEVSARLRAQLGADLGMSRLDASGIEAILRSLPEQAARVLRAEVAPAAAKALDQALALAAQSVRREINRAVLQLMLASEEFDRLTVDRGLKPGDLGARMISESFKRLDDRNRLSLRAHRGASIERMQTMIDAEAHELAASAAGRAAKTLEDLREFKEWPTGLKVELDSRTRTELLKNYGEDALTSAIARLALSLPAGAKADIVIGYSASELGSRLDRGTDGRMSLILGKPGRSPDFSLDAALASARNSNNK